MTKVYIFIFLYLSLGITVISLKRIAKTKDEQLFRYTKTECSSSNMSVSGYFCYIKAFSRSVTSISFGANVTKKLNLMNVPTYNLITLSYVNVNKLFYLDFAQYGIQIWDNLSVQINFFNH